MMTTHFTTLLQCVLRGNIPRGGAVPILQEPIDMAVDSQGNVIIVDAGDGHVKVFDKNGTFLFRIEYAPPDGDSLFRVFTPIAVAVDAQNSIYVCSAAASSVGPAASKQIVTFDQHGNQLGVHGRGFFDQRFQFCPGGLAVNSLGQMVVADVAAQRACILGVDGSASELRGHDEVSGGLEAIFLSTTKDDEIVAVSTGRRGLCRISVYQADGRQLRRTKRMPRLPTGLGFPVEVKRSTYQPLTNRIILETREGPGTVECCGTRLSGARLLYVAVDSLELVHVHPMKDRGGCVSAVPSDFSIVQAPERGPLSLYNSRCGDFKVVLQGKLRPLGMTLLFPFYSSRFGNFSSSNTAVDCGTILRSSRDTAEIRFSAVRSPQFWVSDYCTKRRI